MRNPFFFFHIRPPRSCRIIIVYTVVTEQKTHFFRAMWSRVCVCARDSECARGSEWVSSERRKTCESISFTAVLPHSVYVRILHGNTVTGKNLDPWPVPARVCAHEGEVAGGPVTVVVTSQYFSACLVFTVCVHSLYPLSLYHSHSFLSVYLRRSRSLHSPLAVSLPPPRFVFTNIIIITVPKIFYYREYYTIILCI